MTKIFFVRHGQTEWNLAMRFQGHADIQLTELGKKQAQCVADRLKKEPFSAIYCSDLIRAKDTALAIADYHKTPFTVTPLLREINFGEWEGLSYDAIHSSWPNEVERFFRAPGDVVIPGGETCEALQKRVETILREIITAHKDETVAVVTHGGAIRAALCDALCMPINAFWHIRQDNTAVNQVVYYPEDKRAVVELVNDTNHLSALQIR